MSTLEFGVVLGLVIGGLYALLSVGLVLVYKATRVLNLAHGQIGASSVVVLVYLTLHTNLPYPLCFVIAAALGGAVGLLVEKLYISKLSGAPGLVTLVATLALGQVLAGTVGLIISPRDQSKLGLAHFPQPLHVHFKLAGVFFNGSAVVTVVAVPLVAAGLALFLRYAKYGVAIRAAADNEENARLLAISPRRVSAFAWTLAGVLSALAAVLIDGVKDAGSDFSFGPSLLLRALVPAVIARLSNLWVAAISGVVLGVVEQVVTAFSSNATYTDLILFVAVIGALVVQRQAAGRAGELATSSFPAPLAFRRLPRAFEEGVTLARLRRGVVAAGIALALLIPVVLDDGQDLTITVGVCYAIAGLSVVLLTGVAGQVSLGQWSIAGLGAYAAAYVGIHWHWNVLFALAASVALGAVGSLLIGLPALRLRGLYLAIVSLALAVAANSYLFRTGPFAGVDKDISAARLLRPNLLGGAGVSLFGERAFLYLALVFLGLTMLLVRVVRSGRLGRNMMAVRENERGAAALGVDIVRTKLLAFTLSGAIAGLGGGLYAYAQQGASVSDYLPDYSFLVLALAIVGGVAALSGPLIGALLLVVVPALSSYNPVVGLIASGAGVLTIVVALPGGLVSLLLRLRNVLLGADEKDTEAPAAAGSLDAPLAPPPEEPPPVPPSRPRRRSPARAQ